MKDFLLELQTEELPPKLLVKMTRDLASNIDKELQDADLKFDTIRQFATPRRLAILVKNLEEEQPSRDINKKGPSVSANENAIKGFAKSNGVEVDDLVATQTEKGEYYYFQEHKQGQKTQTLLAEISEHSIKNIPLTRPMRWGNNDFHFIRPVHSLILLFGSEIIPATIMNLPSGNTTLGLRFVEQNAITIDEAQNYQQIMHKQAGIEVCFATRKKDIVEQIQQLAAANNLEYIPNEGLLNEVCGIVEYPKAFMGNFEERFLELPKEVIVNSMAEHQKYFATTKNGALTNTFIAVTNINSKNINVIISGNEKVVRPRLEDSEFFWNNDKKTTLESKLENLQNVLFMKGLGSMFEKTQRLEKLATFSATYTGANSKLAARAGKLAKADLTSDMVGEFASLQGIMGGYYAIIDKEDIQVATAITEHYRPKFAGDELPTNNEGLCVAIADKVDTICGIFAIGSAPTGSKDPYALRRLALGLMRIFIEKNINIELDALVKYSLELHDKFSDELSAQILEFMFERLRSYYREQGIKTSSFLAAKGQNTTNPSDLHLRIVAIDEISKTTDGKDLIEINKRIIGMLKDATFTSNDNITLDIEKELSAQINTINTSNYNALAQDLVSLKPTLDKFFTEVVINDADENIKNARLTLLSKVTQKLALIGDLTLT